MGRQYAVFHLQKGGGTGAGLGHHIDRTVGKERTYPHVTGDRNLNLDFTPSEFKHLSLPQSVSKRLKEGYQGKKAIRKDAVRYVSGMLTGSHAQMKTLERDPVRFKAWLRKNYDFMRETFGESNIVRFTVHRDEKTPHIHCVFVPLTSDGRLSAKEVVGNKKHLQALQDRYQDQMQEFGLERGHRQTGIVRTSVSDYYKLQYENSQEVLDKVQELTVKSFFGVDIGKTTKNFQNELISLKMDLDLTLEKHQSTLESNLEKIKRIENLQQERSNLLNTLKLKENNYKKNYQTLLKNPEIYQEKRQEYQKLEAQIQREKAHTLKKGRDYEGYGF